MSSTVTASNGIQLPLTDLEQTLGYTGDDVTTITVEYRDITYVQTLTYSGSNVTVVSPFIAQP